MSHFVANGLAPVHCFPLFALSWLSSTVAGSGTVCKQFMAKLLE